MPDPSASQPPINEADWLDSTFHRLAQHQPEDAPGEVMEWEFSSLDEFIPFLLRTWVVRVDDKSGRHWCPRFWEHESVEFYFKALWRAWENMKQEETGMVQWTVYYLFPIMEHVFSPTGPLASCTSKQHAEHPIVPVTYDPIPEGFFAPSQPHLGGDHGPV